MQDWLKKISPSLSVIYHSRHSRGWLEPLRIIYDYELVLFSEGKFVVEIEGEAFQCPENSFIIIPPNQLHISRNIISKPGYRHWIHFEWEYHPNNPDTKLLTYNTAAQSKKQRPMPLSVPKGILHGSIKDETQVFNLHEQICEKWNHGSEHEKATCHSLLLQLLVELLDDSSRATEKKHERMSLPSETRILLNKLANKSIQNMPSIQNAMAELGYSYAHLCRQFSKTYGVSPIEYINSLRITRAKLLMRDTDLNISEIAYRVGFENPAYFSRLFRKQTGFSPKQYIQHQAFF